VTRFYVWWNGMPRQKRTGWTLITVSTIYVLWFLKARLFESGPPIANKEWMYFGGMIVLMILGTINIRLAEMRERNEKFLPLVGDAPPQRRRK
jgi:hypothetical protein